LIVSHGFFCEKQADSDGPRLLPFNDFYARGEAEASPVYRRGLVNRAVTLPCVNQEPTNA
jgi:hypothetical protein